MTKPQTNETAQCPDDSNEDEMSDATPDRPDQTPWAEVHADAVKALSQTMRHFNKRGDDGDEVEHPDARQIAFRCVQAFASLKMALLLLDTLAVRVSEMGELWRCLLQPMIEKADMDDAARAEMLECSKNFGSITVAEQDLENLRWGVIRDFASLVESKRDETDS